MLQLGHAELELLVLLAQDEAELTERAVQTGARPRWLGCPSSAAARSRHGRRSVSRCRSKT